MSDAEPRAAVDLDPLVGRVVRLRELRDEDLPSLVEWWNTPEVAAYQRMLTQPRPSEPIAELFRAWGKNDGADCGFCVVTKDTDELAGQVALFGANAVTRCATFAIVLGPAYQDRGLGTDAARVLVRYGFRELGLHRIELEVFGFNPRAMAAYRKAGFVEEGRRREALYRTGRWYDAIVMGLLRSEWEAAHAES